MDIKKKILYVTFGAICLILSIYFIWQLYNYRKTLSKAKAFHVTTTEKVFDLKLEEERLKQEKKDIDNIQIDDPDKEQLLEFLNTFKGKK